MQEVDKARFLVSFGNLSLNKEDDEVDLIGDEEGEVGIDDDVGDISGETGDDGEDGRDREEDEEDGEDGDLGPVSDDEIL